MKIPIILLDGAQNPLDETIRIADLAVGQLLL